MNTHEDELPGSLEASAAAIQAEEDKGNHQLAVVLAKVEIKERLRMPDGDEEVTPPMTMCELETFLNEEDERAKDAGES